MKNKRTKLAIALLSILFVAMVAYVISPLDFLPAFATSFVGCVDDVVAVLGAAGVLVGIVKTTSKKCIDEEVAEKSIA